MAALRKWLLTGLLVIVPGVITAWVLNWIVSTLDQTLQILPGAWQPDKLLGVHVPGFGVVLTLAILLVVGAIASNFAGRKLVEWGDALVHRIPVVRSIYSSVKQVSDRCFPRAAMPFARPCSCSGPAKGYGPWRSSRVLPMVKWLRTCATSSSASTCPPPRIPPVGIL